MKAIYDAVRALAYPKELQHRADKAFKLGSFRVSVREALREFESTNRGIRNRLDDWELSASARNSAAYYELEPQNLAARERLGSTLFRLADAILSGQPHPNSKCLQPLLQAADDSGWVRLYGRQRLSALLQNPAKLGLHKEFYLQHGVHYTDQGADVTLRICDKEGYLQADRAIRVSTVVRSMSDVAAFETEAKTTLSEAFKDVLTWPEFEFRAMCR